MFSKKEAVSKGSNLLTQRPRRYSQRSQRVELVLFILCVLCKYLCVLCVKPASETASFHLVKSILVLPDDFDVLGFTSLPDLEQVEPIPEVVADLVG